MGTVVVLLYTVSPGGGPGRVSGEWRAVSYLTMCVLRRLVRWKSPHGSGNAPKNAQRFWSLIYNHHPTTLKPEWECRPCSIKRPMRPPPPPFKRVEYKSSSDSEDEGMPTFAKVLLGIASICLLPCLSYFYRSVCKERRLENAGGRSSKNEERNAPRGTPSSRSQTGPNAIIVEMESASFSASVRQTAGEQSNGVPPAPFVTMWPASGVEPGATDKSNGAPQRYGRELPVPPPPQQQSARNLNKATALREARREARLRAGEPVVAQGEPVVVHGETVVE